MYKIIIQTKLFVSVSLCCRSATALKQQVSFLKRTNNKKIMNRHHSIGRGLFPLGPQFSESGILLPAVAPTGLPSTSSSKIQAGHKK